ncbi:MAG: chromosome segregation protein SMC [Xanthomonadales bacterium]|nr:chromosome segregation protein SMC [Xanthomonadales bacterium]
MRLSTIKLAGFKSFVDPTTLHLPTNLTGIVGPNGCGKSNIIDAIRWVMGESAASRLRGDQLTDVIFSGSSARKPVGTATVELVFDNADGVLVGEYAGFAEISVKRSVSRDGTSAYFLNGTRCRRRDITDLFLGTGLGPRSYAIIEQGMISEIVEAAPEQLRVHLEEAAGISKYKERRRETENRIRHTRENLERLDDLREEIGKQIEHLRRQARAAERWTELKGELARRQAELHALELGRLEAELARDAAALSERETALERTVAGQRACEAALEALHERQVQAGGRFNQVQAESYRIAGEITRIEQTLAHQKDLAERLARQHVETEQALAEVEGHIGADRGQIEELGAAIADAEPRLVQARGRAESGSQALQAAESALADWQARQDRHARESHETSRAAEVERARIELLDRQCLDADRRLAVLAQERQGNDAEALASALTEMEERETSLRKAVEEATALLEARRQALAAAEREEQALQQQLADLRKQEQAERGRLASLEALQGAALGDDQPARRSVLERLGLAGAPRLGETLRVDPGWEASVETVLAGWLDAAVQDDPGALLEAIAAEPGQGLTVVDARPAAARRPGTLAGHAGGPAAAMALLGKVHVAADRAQAARLLPTLAADESVITADGVWQGHGFVRTVRGDGAQAGVLARENELAGVRAALEATATALADLHGRSLQARDDKRAAEIERDDAQRGLYQAHRALSEIGGALSGQRGRLEGARKRIAELSEEHAILTARLAQDQEDVRAGRARLEQALARMADHESARVLLEGEKRGLLEAREQARQAADAARSELHAVDRELEARRSALTSLEQALARLQGQRGQLVERVQSLGTQIEQARSPHEELAAARQAALEQRILVDRDLVAAREAVEACEAEFRRQEHARHSLEREATELRDRIATARMQAQALQLRAQRLVEEVEQAGFDRAALLAGLEPDADPAGWIQAIDDLEQKIRRLEPVNLAAITEYEEQSKRKEYLDAQNADLTSALETLENAIRRIDRETRSRFKDTFDRVNAGIQVLFPRLFGGGHAYLELTGDDLLTTGVAIMARPPGKRVSSISLLSGGEKALTAAALVFAIFRLNPAPFCLLDEVDAPLDEANVGRFCELVREMSEGVQFLAVTHNKVTMESMRQLCGVTMREPGVSRLVSVDLAEAAELAGAA